MSKNKTRWVPRRLTKTEIILLVFITLLCILGFLSSIIIVRSCNQDKICTTLSCIQAAQQIKESIDETVDPCDDFYQFACGNFLQSNKKKLSSPVVDQIQRTKNQYLSLLAKLPDQPSYITQEKRFLSSCKNSSNWDAENNRIVLDFIEQLGGWPLVLGDSWINRYSDIWEFIVTEKNLGLPFDSILRFDIHEADKFYFKITFPDIVPIENKTDSLYEYFINRVVTILGNKQTTNNREIMEIISFERELTKIFRRFVLKKDADLEYATTITLPIMSFDYFWSNVSWLDFINNISESQNTYDTHIATNVVFQLTNLTKLIERTPMRTLINYAIWKIVYKYSPFLSKEIRDLYQIVDSTRNRNFISQEEFCLTQLHNRFKKLNEALYARTYATHPIRKNIMEILNNLYNRIKVRVTENDWMDDATRRNALEKIKNLTSLIGGPEEYFQEEQLINQLGFDQFEFESDNIIYMIRQLDKHETKVTFRPKHYKSNELNSLFTDWININARFARNWNTIMVPASMLQDIFYATDRPNYLNYGGIGSILGHELVHGFDSRTTSYLRNGKPFEWMTVRTEKKYQERIRCLSEDYSNFGKSQLNGTLTVYENLADFVGIDLAYEAYKQWVQHNKEEQQLPGLDYTPNQLFWIQFSTYMCFRASPDSNDASTMKDSHSIPSYRVIGTMRNSRYFAKDFQCPENSYMNPKDKCNPL